MALLAQPIKVALNAIYNVDEEFTIFIRQSSNKPIASISVGNPTIIATSEDHGYKNGDNVLIWGTNSSPQIQDLGETWVVTRIDRKTFSVPANVSLNDGNQGWVAGPLQDISGYTFSGGIYKCDTAPEERYLDVVGDTSNNNKRAVLKSNYKDEIDRIWDGISIGQAVSNVAYRAAPVEPDQLYLSTNNLYRYHRVITLGTPATLDLTDGRVKGHYQKHLGTTTKIVDANIETTNPIGKIKIKFARADLSSAINGCKLLVFAESVSNSTKSLIVDGTCSYTEC